VESNPRNCRYNRKKSRNLLMFRPQPGRNIKACLPARAGASGKSRQGR
jgi:hypothetical protein